MTDGTRTHTPVTGASDSLAGLLAAPAAVVTVGAPVLDEALAAQGVPTVPVEWRPPPAASREAVLSLTARPGTGGANRTAVERMAAVRPRLVDVLPAAEAVGIGPHQLLHAGPPVDWDAASGPLRGAIVGACLYEGWAGTPEEAEALASSEIIELSPCHDHGCAGPMAGIVSPSMPLWSVTDGNGRTTRSTLNEGLGKVLRYGAFGPAVTERLEWMQRVLGPALAAALRRHGPVDVGSLIASMVAMGDEGHNRNRAGTSLLVRALAPDLVRTIDDGERGAGEVADVLAFVDSNDHFLLNVVMAAAKLVADAGAGVPGSSVVVAMARNGTEFGIRVSGTADRWFTAPAAVPDGLFLGGYGPGDANPDIGDSAITETVGLGGFAMAAAPRSCSWSGAGSTTPPTGPSSCTSSPWPSTRAGPSRRWASGGCPSASTRCGWCAPESPHHQHRYGRQGGGNRPGGCGPGAPAARLLRRRARRAGRRGRDRTGGRHVKPAPFTYHRPTGVEEAARLLADLGEDAKVIAGGQSLVPLMNFRLAAPDHLVDVNRLGGLDHLQVGEDAVEVGATVRTADLLRGRALGEAHPLLAAAAGWIAHPVIRNRGTVCGSLAHADPAAELPAVLALLDGDVEAVAWRSGALARRWIAAAELFVGPFETSLEPDELVVAARFPRLAPGSGWAMDELARRHGDYALAGVALTITVDGEGAPTGGRAAFLSCAPTPIVLDLGPALASADGPAGDRAAPGVDDAPSGGAGEGAASATAARDRAVYDLAAGALNPTADIHATADYRRHLAATLTVRSLAPALSHATAAAGEAGRRPLMLLAPRSMEPTRGDDAHRAARGVASGPRTRSAPERPTSEPCASR